MLNTKHFSQCIQTLESSLSRLQSAKPESIDYEIFRNATVKGFELTLETAGKLLRKVLKTFVANPRNIDELTYKEVLRQSAKHNLLKPECIERWFLYRDNRNDTAHDYGINFVKTTLKLLPDFLKDAKELRKILESKFGEDNANA